MKRKIIISFYIISLTLVVLSLARIFLGKYVKYPYSQEIKNVKIVDLNNDNLTLSMSIDVFNPNSFQHKIQGGYFKIYYKNEIIGNAKIIKEFYIEADTSQTVELVVNLQTKKLSKSLSEKTKEIEITLDGEIYSNILFYCINLNVNLNYKINIFEVLTNCLEDDTKGNKIIKINSTNLKHLDLETSTINTNFTFFNPYKIDFTLKSYPCKIYLNNNYIGDGNTLNSIFIDNKTEQTDGQFQFILNNFDFSSNVIQNLIQFKSKMHYETKGMLYLEILGYDINIPYNYQGELLDDILGN